MKKLLSALLLLVMLCQTVPFDALASVGRVLSTDELARAYAITGLGTGGLVVKNGGAYHAGMKPNASWNASQLRDWLGEKLNVDINTISDLLSQASFTLSDLKESNPETYAVYAQGQSMESVRELYLEAEALRETLRWYQDQLYEASNVIAEMTRWLKEENSALFDSDKVRYSARIEEAEKKIVEYRREIAENALAWEKQITQLKSRLQTGIDAGSGGDEGSIGDWMTGLLGEGAAPTTDTASVSRISPSASRTNRLSVAAGLAANDVAEAKITVVSENEVAILLQSGSSERPVPVGGAQLKVKDALIPDAPVQVFTSDANTGTVLMPVNQFTMDEFGVLHLRVEADPAAQGYHDFLIEDMDLEKGEIFTCNLIPIDAPAGNDGDKPHAYMMSLAGKDIMLGEYEMIYSPLNDHEFEIKVGIRNTEGKDLPDLLMRYYENVDKTSPQQERWASPVRKEGDVYVFKGPWKQKFSPWASVEQRPTFMFGKDASADLTFPSQLVSMKSATEEPLNEGTGPDGGVFANILGKGLGFSFKIPKVGINVSFKMPFQKYLPRLSVDPGGFVTIFMGDAVFEDNVKKSKLNWQSNDTRQFRQLQRYVEKEGFLANTKAQYNVAKDYYKTKMLKFMGDSSIDVGFFVVLTGRWQLDKDIPDVKTTLVSLRGGGGVTVSYSFSWTLSYPILGIPLYVCFTLGVSAGFAAQMVFDFTMVNGEFGKHSFRFLNDLTIDIGFMASAQLGVGIKGFLEGWVRLVASLDFIIRLSIEDVAPTGLTITGSVLLSVGLTVFFATASKTWDIISGQLWPRNSANLLQHYMNPGDGEAQHIDAASDEPHRYPALAAEAQIVRDGTNDEATSGYKLVRVGGKNFIFCIRKVWDTGKTRRQIRRVSWLCLNPDESTESGWQSTQDVVDHLIQHKSNLANFIVDKQDYDFDVYSDGRFVFLLVAGAKDYDENGYPLRNDLRDDESLYNNRNAGLYLVVLQHDGNSVLNYELPAYLSSWGYEVRYEDVQGMHDMDQYSYDSYAHPRIIYARAVWKEGDQIIYDPFEMYATCDRVAYPEEDATAGTTGIMYNKVPLKFFTDRLVKCAMGDDYERVQALPLLDMDLDFTLPGIELSDYSNNGYGMSFIGLSKPKGGKAGDSVIELFGFDMNKTPEERKAIALETGVIDHITLVQGRQGDGAEAGRTVFYTMQERNDDGATRNRLHGLHIAPVKNVGTDHPEYDVTKYTYDAVIPTDRFDVCYMAGVPYLYWVSTAEKQSKNEPDTWRVWTMCYDASANTLTDPSVFAEFTLPTILYKTRDRYGCYDYYYLPTVPGSVILTGTGTAYVNAVATDWETIREDMRPKMAPNALLSFPEQLTPSATVTTVIPRELAIKAGDFEDVTIGLRNDGNMGIAAFDVAMYEVVDGVEGEKPVETVHVDAVDPEKSKVTLADGSVVMTGKQVARREEDLENTPRRRNWVLDQETTAYSVTFGDKVDVDTRVIEPSAPRLVLTDVLMPGSTGAYAAAFKIPEDWRGAKTLRMKLTALWAESNLARAVADAAGIRSNGGEASTTLKYVLNESTGKLELQQPLEAGAALKDALENGLYADAVAVAAADMMVDVHDLEIKHRIYRGLSGERMLDIVLHNHAATREPLTLSCSVYVDGASDPYILKLPYYQQATSIHRTQTITLPVSALVDDPAKHRLARVAITAVGTDERAWANNEFTVYFDGEDPLRFIRQPQDVTVQAGEDVSFSVEVAGGVRPYTCQWQVYNSQKGKWVDLKGFNQLSISRRDITKKWDGCRFRCVVTDAAGTQIISREVTLTVRSRVDTGDHSNMPLYLAAAIFALALLWWMRRRRA